MCPCVHWLSCHFRSHSEATPFQSPSVPGFSAQVEKLHSMSFFFGFLSVQLWPKAGLVQSGFHPSNCRGYSRMDRSLDTEVWEKLLSWTWLDTSVLLAVGGPPRIQLALRLFWEARSMEERPNILHSGRSKSHAQDSPVGHVCRGPQDAMSSLPPSGYTGAIQTSSKERKTGGWPNTSSHCFQNILLETQKTKPCFHLSGSAKWARRT